MWRIRFVERFERRIEWLGIDGKRFDKWRTVDDEQWR